jgi:hypothetical protein
VIDSNHPNYQRPVQVRPVPSSNRQDAPVGRYVYGRAPDESVWSYRARLHAADPKNYADPGDPPAPRRRAWLTQAEWRSRDAEKLKAEGA